MCYEQIKFLASIIVPLMVAIMICIVTIRSTHKLIISQRQIEKKRIKLEKYEQICKLIVFYVDKVGGDCEVVFERAPSLSPTEMEDLNVLIFAYCPEQLSNRFSDLYAYTVTAYSEFSKDKDLHGSEGSKNAYGKLMKIINTLDKMHQEVLSLLRDEVSEV